MRPDRRQTRSLLGHRAQPGRSRRRGGLGLDNAVRPGNAGRVIVPLTVNDFLDRAETVYGDRVGVVDEPDQPADSWGDLTYREVGERARAMAARLDALGIGFGDRVAMVSHNSARLLTAMWGVSGFGRVLVPVNFRLSRDEVAYIVEHCGARVLFVDPELADSLKGIEAEHTYVMGSDD